MPYNSCHDFFFFSNKNSEITFNGNNAHRVVARNTQVVQQIVKKSFTIYFIFFFSFFHFFPYTSRPDGVNVNRSTRVWALRFKRLLAEAVFCKITTLLPSLPPPEELLKGNRFFRVPAPVPVGPPLFPGRSSAPPPLPGPFSFRRLLLSGVRLFYFFFFSLIFTMYVYIYTYNRIGTIARVTTSCARQRGAGGRT